ncbi:glutamate-1-semialdehyde 2,1-aminomutase [Neorhodopirellula pilleata]|nr:glutamate-1-semialdehyde 2,1-aminomutase [Neorhodopirellula pilleata]
MSKFERSRAMQRRVHEVIPGGCHTYAKGDDQFPYLSPGFITRGKGSHVWDVDGNEYIEYGMGCRAVSLGHAFPPIVDAVRQELEYGSNFTRPAAVELECAEVLLHHIGNGDMCKFAKDGSTVTTTALKLARAYTGRDRVALCADQPFFAIHDWFIGTTGISAGIPQAIRDLSLVFRYNDPESLEFQFRKFPNQIAAVILEAAKYEDPQDDFLHRVQEICHRHGAIFILDEMITGFRWHSRGAQHLYDIEPDLSTFGKALANGFSASALIGKRELMRRCGIYHDEPRVFAMSTTHGAETHALRAVMATIDFYQNYPVVETLERQGQKLVDGIKAAAIHHGLENHVDVIGRPSCLVFTTRDADGEYSQAFRSLLMQELIKHGVLGPSLVISYSHDDDDVAKTIAAYDKAMEVYRNALENGVNHYLIGPVSQVVYQPFNSPGFSSAYTEVP